MRERAHAGALVTGEVIGQVASQTLENMATIGSVATLPVFRPLIGMDKDEIIDGGAAARDISDLHHRGSGLLPAVYAQASRDQGTRRDDIDAAERALPIDDFVRQAVESAVVEDFNYPVIKYPAI